MNVIEHSASYTHQAAQTPCVILAAKYSSVMMENYSIIRIDKSTVPLKVNNVAIHGRGEGGGGEA